VILSPAIGIAYGKAEAKPMKSTGLTSEICPTPVSMYCGGSVLRRRVIVVDTDPRIYTQDSPAKASRLDVKSLTADSNPVGIVTPLYRASGTNAACAAPSFVSPVTIQNPLFV
jgi:hypothetical protein